MNTQNTFKTLADPVRRDILVMLKQYKMSDGDISTRFSMTGSTISYDLLMLKQAGLIFKMKYKNYVFYELNTTVFEEIVIWVLEFKGGNYYEK